ncbi:MAG: DUF927 domain-containing protein [Candidatus Desulfofervidaceae bacterium]|nr:DUF927 domain-containing protein [Candidatus Desulfofervidaceae bacterium]
MLLKMLNCRAGISCLAALAAPLVRLCRTPNFIVSFAEKTDVGKTTAHRFSMSLYGDPQKLMSTLDTTAVGNERLANQFRDFPLWLDELETVKSRELHQYVSLVYQFTQGKGRTRSNIFLDIRPTAVFRGIALVSMEQDLETIVEKVMNMRTKPRGLARRILELSDLNFYTPFNPHIIIPFRKEINHFSFQHFGAFGKRWIEYIMSNQQQIRRMYKEKLSYFQEKAGGLEQLLCMMYITVDFVYDLLQKTGIEAERPIEIQEYIISSLQKEVTQALQEKKDILGDAQEKLVAWCFGNRRNFIGLVEEDKLMGIWGVVKRDRIFVTANAFSNFCNMFGFVKKQVVEAFETAGLLVSNRVGKKGCVKKINGRSVMGYHELHPLPEEKTVCQLFANGFGM